LEDDEKDLWGDEIKNCNIRLWTATNGCLWLRRPRLSEGRRTKEWVSIRHFIWICKPSHGICRVRKLKKMPFATLCTDFTKVFCTVKMPYVVKVHA
jgi:hypothetical protein